MPSVSGRRMDFPLPWRSGRNCTRTALICLRSTSSGVSTPRPAHDSLKWNDPSPSMCTGAHAGDAGGHVFGGGGVHAEGDGAGEPLELPSYFLSAFLEEHICLVLSWLILYSLAVLRMPDGGCDFGFVLPGAVFHPAAKASWYCHLFINSLFYGKYKPFL